MSLFTGRHRKMCGRFSVRLDSRLCGRYKPFDFKYWYRIGG